MSKVYSSCHPEVIHHAKGLCKICYLREYRKTDIYAKSSRSEDRKRYQAAYKKTAKYKEQQKEYCKAYRQTEDYIERRRQYQRSDYYKKQRNQYAKNLKRRSYQNAWRKTPEAKAKLVNRKKTDIQFRLRVNLRTRLSKAIKTEQKTGSAVKDLGCTIQYFKSYIESQFQPGMTWENWGKYGWHLDHITPLSSFDLTDREQLLKACHYTNLQPLWARDNLEKGNKML